MNSAAFHQLIRQQQWTEGRPPQQWRIQNYVCQENCLFEIMDGPSLDLLAAGSENFALNSRSFPLALQFLVQQPHFMSSIEQVPVVQRSDPSCTAHPRSDTPKRTTKCGTRGKDRSKKNNERKADKITALRCKLEGLKVKNYDLSKLIVARRFGRLAQREKQRSTGRSFIHSNKKQSSEICVPPGANFVNQPSCKNLSHFLHSPHP